jgi:hypothetical protein
VDVGGAGELWLEATELGVPVGSLEPPDPPQAAPSRQRLVSTPVACLRPKDPPFDWVTILQGILSWALSQAVDRETPKASA